MQQLHKAAVTFSLLLALYTVSLVAVVGITIILEIDLKKRMTTLNTS